MIGLCGREVPPTELINGPIGGWLADNDPKRLHALFPVFNQDAVDFDLLRLNRGLSFFPPNSIARQLGDLLSVRIKQRPTWNQWFFFIPETRKFLAVTRRPLFVVVIIIVLVWQGSPTRLSSHLKLDSIVQTSYAIFVQKILSIRAYALQKFTIYPEHFPSQKIVCQCCSHLYQYFHSCLARSLCI
jgi:hypothetical protein